MQNGCLIENGVGSFEGKSGYGETSFTVQAILQPSLAPDPLHNGFWFFHGRGEVVKKHVPASQVVTHGKTSFTV